MLLPARIAIAFLTILPSRLPGELSEGSLKRSTAFFPLAGWLIGGLLAGSAWLFSRLGLPSLVAAVLLVTFGAWLTRGLHLDGLADLADGLGGGQNQEERLAIMKDSTIGAFGVVALVLLLLLKISSLAAMGETGGGRLFFALCAGPVASRWAMAVLAAIGHYPRAGGTGHAFVGKAGSGEVAIAALWLAPFFLWHWQMSVLVLAAAFLPAAWLWFKTKRALGGVTGDVLGAACELGEACVWLAIVLF